MSRLAAAVLAVLDEVWPDEGDGPPDDEWIARAYEDDRCWGAATRRPVDTPTPPVAPSTLGHHA